MSRIEEELIGILTKSSKKFNDRVPMASHAIDMDKLAAEFRARAEMGKAKYGVTVEDAPLKEWQWMQHLKEELMDSLVYLTRILDDLRNTMRNGSAIDRLTASLKIEAFLDMAADLSYNLFVITKGAELSKNTEKEDAEIKGAQRPVADSTGTSGVNQAGAAEGQA